MPTSRQLALARFIAAGPRHRTWSKRLESWHVAAAAGWAYSADPLRNFQPRLRRSRGAGAGT